MVSLLAFIVVLVALIAFAERSLRRQRNSGLKRSAEQDRAIGRMNVMMGRWPGSGGSG